MDYTITEYEYNVIDDVRGMLNLVACLVGATSSKSGLYDESDMCSFLTSQVDALDRIKKTVMKRFEEDREASMGFRPPASEPVHDPVAALTQDEASAIKAMLAMGRASADTTETKKLAKVALRKRETLAAKQLQTVESSR